MNFLLNFILFLTGISVGSFINVISLRYNPEEKILSKRTIGGRSHCPYCHKELRWFELIPLVSFLWQKGKCRGCGRFLFWQYPLVEILSGLIFLFVPLKIKIFNFQFSFLRQGFGGQVIFNFQSIFNYQLLIAAVWIFIFELFLLIAIIDFRHYIIPDQLNLSLAFLGFVLLILNQFINLPINQLTNSTSFLGYYSALINPFSNIWVNHFFAAFIAMFFFGIIIFLTRGKGMGWGDFKLAGALGLIFGWPDILIVVALSFVIGSIISVILMLQKEKNYERRGAVRAIFGNRRRNGIFFRLSTS